MRILKILGVAFLTGFSGAMMPGPLLALTLGQVSLTGWVAVPLLMAGHALLELLIVGLLLLGVIQLLVRPRPRAVLSLVGGVALLYMGVDMLRSAATLQVAAASGEAYSPLMLLAAGASVSLANPYFLGWWATIGAGGMASLAPRTRPEYLAFYLGHEASDFGWYGLVGLLLVTGRRFLSPRVYQGLVLASGVAVILLALWFLWTGVQILRGKLPHPALPPE